MTYTAETRVFHLEPENPDREVIRAAADALRAGQLVAFPTETVYGLGANALDSEAVGRIFRAKGRPATDPLIVHLYSAAQLRLSPYTCQIGLQLAGEFWPGPLTLVLPRGSSVPPNVSAGLDTVAVRVPRHPVALALLRAADVPVAAPSANLFAHPSATTAQHVLDDLRGRVDIVLDAGPTAIGLESTVLDLTQSPPVVLRPGGVPVERLRELIGSVELNSRYLTARDSPGQSPGMLAKHYSPRAQVLLFSGPAERVIPRMQETVQQRIARQERVGIMIPDAELVYFQNSPARVITLGNSLAEISHNLFDAMRALDGAGVEVILAHGFEQEGLGSRCNRLLRAAEGRVIEC
jgi:L-threonylcarbamoyladenylate synthase